MNRFTLFNLFVPGIVALLPCDARGDEKARSPAAAYELKPGPQLFIDDFLIERVEGIQRRVMQPKRTLDEPVITAAHGHLNWQPWLTVIHDDSRPAESRFRVWYNADVDANPAEGKFRTKLGYLESSDGVRWPGTPQKLEKVGDILFGASVIDDGPKFARPDERYKILYWRNVVPSVAFSPDGLKWTMHNGGRQILDPTGDSWHAAYDPLRQRYFLFGKSNQVHNWTNAEGKALSKRLRLFGTATSDDFKTWKDFKIQFATDEYDPGITEGYAVTGFQTRGDLLFGFFQVLRDDLSTEGAPYAAKVANPTTAAGMGHTVLCWTRDGETWHRDREPDAFLTPDPKVGTWDHAMAWVSSVVPVGDELFVYYTGYRWGHKYRRSEDRQVGLVRMRRDRYVAREAADQPGVLTTRPLTLNVDGLTLNLDAAHGEARVQVCDVAGKPLPGFTFAECRPIAEDSLAAAVVWSHKLSELRGQTVRLQFSLRQAKLFAFDTR